jgi:hypothetical protein
VSFRIIVVDAHRAKEATLFLEALDVALVS